MRKRWVSMLEDAFLVALAGDLLYLYYIGAWYDPFGWIEIAEVVLLYLLIAFGLIRLYLHWGRVS